VVDEIFLRYGLALLVLFLGGGFLFGLFRFGAKLFGDQAHDMWQDVREVLHHFGPDHRRYRIWIDTLTNWNQVRLEKRNDFWEQYGQVALAILIVVVLAVLLLVKAISAEAGLPILSAVAGFAIAKTNASGGAARRTTPTNDNE